jgi:hypothetical protein
MRRQPTNRYVSGDYLRDCDICDWTYLRSELTRTWDGWLACRKDWYPKPERFIEKTKITEKAFEGD